MSVNTLAPLEAAIGRLFRAGIKLSATLLLAGLLLSFAHVGFAPTVLSAGLVVLMVIPAARVLMSSFDAMRRRDALLIAATLAVIVELIWLYFLKR